MFSTYNFIDEWGINADLWSCPSGPPSWRTNSALPPHPYPPLLTQQIEAPQVHNVKLRPSMAVATQSRLIKQQLHLTESVAVHLSPSLWPSWPYVANYLTSLVQHLRYSWPTCQRMWKPGRQRDGKTSFSPQKRLPLATRRRSRQLSSRWLVGCHSGLPLRTARSSPSRHALPGWPLRPTAELPRRQAESFPLVAYRRHHHAIQAATCQSPRWMCRTYFGT